MTLETRKIRLAQSILGNLSEETISKLEVLISEDEYLKEILTQRALQSEEDIKDGKYHTFEESKKRIERSLG